MPVIEQKTTNKNKVDFDLNRLDKSKTTIFSKYPNKPKAPSATDGAFLHALSSSPKCPSPLFRVSPFKNTMIYKTARWLMRQLFHQKRLCTPFLHHRFAVLPAPSFWGFGRKSTDFLIQKNILNLQMSVLFWRFFP